MQLFIESPSVRDTLGADSEFALGHRSKQFIAACLLYTAAFKLNKTSDGAKSFLKRKIPYYMVRDFRRDELFWLLDNFQDSRTKKQLLETIT